MTVLKVYKSYNFRDKNPVVDVLRTAMRKLGWNHKRLSDETGISRTTIKAIFSGPTKDPRHGTICRLAIALGQSNMRLVPEARTAAARKEPKVTGGSP
jgi:transcriptional regulator with XRE-family HTH domain